MYSRLMTSSVRLLRVEEFDQWLPLWKGYQEFYRVELSDEVTQTTWARFFEESEPMHAFGAFLNDEMVGISHSIFHRSCWLIDPVCYLQDLFVNPEVRGKGIGTQLVEAVESHAQEHGIKRVQWLTHETNSTGIRLYDQIATRTGFIQYRRG